MKLFFGAGKTIPISAATELRDHLRADRKHQYQDGYSMAEAAKCWVSAKGCLPEKIGDVVGSSEFNSAHFEFPTPVWGGGIAMTDVMAFLPDGVVAIEAKVGEPFDDVVSVWIERNAKDGDRSPSHRREVVGRYADAFSVQPAQLYDIRYQLLQRTLSAAITARAEGSSRCWMIVQSFASLASPGHRQNRMDFDQFQDLIGKAPIIEGVRVETAWTDNACAGPNVIH